MPITRSMKTLSGGVVRPVVLALFLLGSMLASFISPTSALAQSAATPTTINITDSAKMTNARRLGVNIGAQDFWDSGQMMRQIMFRNPGFEGEQWQSILHCKYVTATSCTDDDIYTGWPADFLKGGQAEFILGNAIGTFATVTGMTAASESAGVGVTVNLSGVSIPPSVGDYLVVRLEIPGNAAAGWWTTLSSGASLSTEFTDLSPNSPGKQALRVTVPAGQTATVNSYTDGYAGRSFLQMNGSYTLTFRAKSTGGSTNINASVIRSVSAPPGISYLNQNVALTTSWQDYSYTFSANDTGRAGSIQLSFAMNGASVLLDDVALTAAAAPDNPTNYRNEVVSTLRALNPGTLRYMDSGTNWGSSIDNMLAPDFARERPGYSNFNSESDQIPMGLHDFLTLCEAVGTEPWYTMPTGMSVQEMTNLMEYLGGSTSTTYGAKRAALGHPVPWTSVFKTIHLEFGNEVWNTANPGATMTDAAAYGERSGLIFTTAKSSPYYSSNGFDFIVDGFEVIPSWNQIVLANSSNYNTIDVATYIFTSFNDTSSTENIYGPMFAEPEMQVDTAGGIMNQQAVVAAAATVPANLAVYESNISAGNGTATQAAVNSAVPSVAAGITASLNLLIAQRDLGVNNQNLFSLSGYQYNFLGATSTAASTSPIWGSVVDMGGQSNLQRPNFLSEQLANSAILPQLLTTSQTGANPTWNQALSTNDDVALPAAHYIQSFAYTDGTTLNTIIFNLSRTTALPVVFAGLNAPVGAATISTLTGSNITASNESGENVAIATTSQTLQAGSPITLPPYSMTVISAAAPVVPIMITSVSVTCARSTLSPNGTTTCTPTVVGQGKYNSGVTWTVDQGTISSTGSYSAPSTVPANGVANIKITSVQDTTKTATFPISIAPNTVTGVKVSCNVSTLGQGLNTNCTASVSGTGSFSNAYVWSMSGGSITPAGLLTAALTGTSMTVTATSTQDKTKSASTTIALTQVITISNPVLTTTSTSITASWTVNMAARNGVGYGIAGGSTTGTPYINATMTNPSFVLSGLTPGATYDLWLSSYTSTQTTTKTMSVTIPMTSAPTSTVTGVSVSCNSASILQSAGTTCAATVAGTGTFAHTVTWSVSGGSITTAGVLSAPTTGTAITVTATSTQDKTKSGTFAISLNSPSTLTGVSVSCSSASIFQGGSASCAATVAGTGTIAHTVTWSVSSGSITSAGVLTAPTTGTAITVTATSTQDKTKSGTFAITLNPVLSINNPVMTTTSTTITAVWSDSIAARNEVSYSIAGGTTTGTPYDSSSITNPSYTITGLTPGATYNLLLTAYTSTQTTTKLVTVSLPPSQSSSTVTGVNLICADTTLVLGTTSVCRAVVVGTNDPSQAITFSTSAGAISSLGILTAPASGKLVQIKATSVQDPTKSATYTIALTPTVLISNQVITTTSTSITASWTTNVLTHNGLGYGIVGGATTGTPYDNGYSSKPSYTLTGLTPGATYSLWLTSYKDQASLVILVNVTIPNK
jgi:alpha-L-arabinofuranosidase